MHTYAHATPEKPPTTQPEVNPPHLHQIHSTSPSSSAPGCELRFWERVIGWVVGRGARGGNACEGA